MVRKKKIRVVLMALLLGPGLAMAISQWQGFSSASSRGFSLPENFNGFPGNEKDEISLGWMHLIHLDQGGWISLLFTYANLGPYDGLSSITLLHLRPDGTQQICKGTWSDKGTFHAPPAGKYQIGIHDTTFGGKYPDFFVNLKDTECSGELSFHSLVPPFRQGTGKATFFNDRSKYWSLLAISPRARVSGKLNIKGTEVNAAGNAYLELVANNILVPKISDRWYILRTVSGPYTINLFDIIVKKDEFGDGHLRTLMVARDGEILMGTTDFEYEPQGGEVDPASGIKIPDHFALNARDGTTTLTGTVKTGKILLKASLFDEMSAVTKMVASFLYGKPWQYRSAAEYDLVLREGEKETHIKGVGFKEIHYYDN